MSESFDWNYPGLNWSHFHSLANLLSLRNGGQAEPSSLSDTVLEEDWDPDDNGDEDAPSMDTGFARQISDSGHGRLKRRFLDCLAEFAANKKGGRAVVVAHVAYIYGTYLACDNQIECIRQKTIIGSRRRRRRYRRGRTVSLARSTKPP